MTGPGRDVVIRLLAQGSQEVVAAVRSVRDEIKALAATGATSPAASSFKTTATEAATLATELSTVTTAAKQADAAVRASAEATGQLGAAQEQAATQTARLTGEARTAAAAIANALQTATRGIRDELGRVIGAANLPEQAAEAARQSGAALETGLTSAIADLRGKLASGAIDPATFRAQAQQAIQAFQQEATRLLASLPPIPVKTEVDTGRISAQELQAAELASTQAQGVSQAARALGELDQTLSATVAEFQAGKLTVQEFAQAVLAIRGDALASVGETSSLTAQELAKLNNILSQTERLATVGFSAILQSVQEAQVGFKTGTLNVLEYEQALGAARTEAIALAQATGELSGAQLQKLNQILNQTAGNTLPAVRGMGSLKSGMASVTAQAIGLTSGLGTVGNALLTIATGSVIATGILLAVGAAVTAYRFFTTASREAREEHDKLVQSLLQEAQSALPEDQKAMESLTAAIDNQSRARERLAALQKAGQVAGVVAAAPVIGSTATAAGQVLSELQRRAQKDVTDGVKAETEAREKLAEATRNQVVANVEALTRLIQLGQADIDQKKTAQSLVDLLTLKLKTENLSLADQARILGVIQQAQQALRADPIGDARRSASQANDQRELARALSLNQSLAQINEQAFARATQDLSSFFATRKQLIEDNTQKEVATLLAAARREATRPLQGVTPEDLDADRIKRQQAADDLRAQANQRLIQGEQQLRGLAEDERTTYRQITDQRLEGERQILAARGQNLAASLSEIAQQSRAFRETLNQTPGLTQEQRDQEGAEFDRVLRLKAQADEVQRSVDLAFAELERARAAIQDQVATGQLTEVEGNARIAQLERDRLPTLQALAGQMTTFANALGDPALQSAAADLETRLTSMGAAANATVQQVAALKDQLTQRFAELDRAKQAIQNQVATGQITPDQGEDRIAALEKDRLATLREISAELEKIGIESGNVGLQQEVASLNSQLDTLAASADRAGQQTAQAIQEITGALTSAISGFLTDTLAQIGTVSETTTTVTDAMGHVVLDDLGRPVQQVTRDVFTLGDAFKSLALSVVKAIQQIVAQLLAAQIVKSIAGSLFGGAGFDPSNPGIAGADAGGNIIVPGLATGGHIRGRGTGTSDSILAWLSNGERVITAADEALFIRRYGWDWVTKLRLTAPRFAAGGHVAMTAPAPTAAPVSVNLTADQLAAALTVSLSDGLVLDQMRANFPVLVKQHKRLIGQVAGGDRR